MEEKIEMSEKFATSVRKKSKMKRNEISFEIKTFFFALAPVTKMSPQKISNFSKTILDFFIDVSRKQVLIKCCCLKDGFARLLLNCCLLKNIQIVIMLIKQIMKLQSVLHSILFVLIVIKYLNGLFLLIQ